MGINIKFYKFSGSGEVPGSWSLHCLIKRPGVSFTDKERMQQQGFLNFDSSCSAEKYPKLSHKHSRSRCIQDFTDFHTLDWNTHRSKTRNTKKWPKYTLKHTEINKTRNTDSLSRGIEDVTGVHNWLNTPAILPWSYNHRRIIFKSS